MYAARHVHDKRLEHCPKRLSHRPTFFIVPSRGRVCLQRVLTKATLGGGTPIFTGVFEPLARVALYPTDEDGLGICFGAA